MNNLVKCDACEGKVRVVDKRNRADCIWRRRKCENCAKTTYSIEISIDKDSDETLYLDIDMLRQRQAPDFIIKQNGVKIDDPE